MQKGIFKFKHFEVSHQRSSMKIGVDAVLIGAWASAGGSKILDVGTGCGVIALMMAQREPDAEISAIDIDAPSVEEAAENFRISPWRERLRSNLMSFEELLHLPGRFDLIISNPPYFDAGVKVLDDSRKKARHVGKLSPETLVKGAGMILEPGGCLAMIVTSEYVARIGAVCNESGMTISRLQYVRDHREAPVKRVMLELVKMDNGSSDRPENEPSEMNILTMFESDGLPTEEYRELCGDFYLQF